MPENGHHDDHHRHPSTIHPGASSPVSHLLDRRNHFATRHPPGGRGGHTPDTGSHPVASVAAGPVDSSRISVAGHSDGGSAVAVLALDSTYRDPRIASYLVLSGAIPDGVGGTWGQAAQPGRLLVVVGSDDEYGNLPASTAVFDAAAMSKTLVIANGGDHLGTYLGTGAVTTAVRAATLSFLGQQQVVPTTGSPLTVTAAAS